MCPEGGWKENASTSSSGPWGFCVPARVPERVLREVVSVVIRGACTIDHDASAYAALVRQIVTRDVDSTCSVWKFSSAGATWRDGWMMRASSCMTCTSSFSKTALSSPNRCASSTVRDVRCLAGRLKRTRTTTVSFGGSVNICGLVRESAPRGGGRSGWIGAVHDVDSIVKGRCTESEKVWLHRPRFDRLISLTYEGCVLWSCEVEQIHLRCFEESVSRRAEVASHLIPTTNCSIDTSLCPVSCPWRIATSASSASSICSASDTPLPLSAAVSSPGMTASLGRTATCPTR
mmetsp:Transcript_21967/g.52777  ORF Transcript_21967/g.52777 Transcript_21967/m.52777 type:complete len:290 (+) Transcript_21967:556-1425(+)